MAHLIREAGPQEPIYGIHHANIVKRLTRQNWRTKAVARFDSKGWIYLWVIRRRYRHPAGGISATTPSRPIPTLRRVLGARLSGALPTSGRRPGVCERRG